ncbi:hypothetical protein L218DRAFT_287081 [Marasmius fiardii PR-910]|nr:hypothetical protein L218DRAFT_287081 [Marasmius fiardii PR-910]
MPLPHLPLDVIDSILSHCHYDRTTRRSCSLVCKAWLPLNRYHLFRHRAISIVSDEEAAEFSSVISSSHCTFIPFIRGLKISIHPGETFDPWTAYVLQNMHEKKATIRKLILLQLPWRLRKSEETTRSTDKLGLLVPLIQDTMISLDLTTWERMPWALRSLADCSFHLKHVTIHTNSDEILSWSSICPNPKQVLKKTQHIFTLSLNFGGRDLDLLLAWTRVLYAFPFLSHLHLRMGTLEAASTVALQTFLSIEARSVEHLFLEWVSSDDHIEGLNLSPLHQLRSLQLSFSGSSESCQAVSHIVCSLQSNSALGSIILLCRQNGDPSYLRFAAWQRLDITLADTGCFPRLREIVARPTMIPFLPTCATKGMVRSAETKFPLRTRWFASLSSAYPEV